MFVISSYYDSRQRVALSSVSVNPVSSEVNDYEILDSVKKEIDRVVPEKYRMVKGRDSLSIIKLQGEVSIQNHVVLYPR